MKHIFKRLTSAWAVLLCTMLLFGSAQAVFAEEIDENIKETLIQSVKGATDSLIALTDEEIETLIENGNSFSKLAAEAWKSSKGEVGEKEADQMNAGQTTVTFDDNTYTVVYPVDFTEADADFVYMFDKAGVPQSVTVDVKLPMGTTMKRAALNTVMGIGTVFIMLIFLSFIISLFKYIPNGSKKKAAQAMAPEASVLPRREAPQMITEDLTDDLELVAVITAAIAAAQGSETTDGFVVRSIRKAKRTR